jgi:hypothetical protein
VIVQVLNREFLLEMTGEVRRNLERELKQQQTSRRRGTPTPLDEFDDADVRSLMDELGDVDEQPEGLDDDASDEEPSPENVPERARPKDDFAFVPRSALLSLVQTSLEDYFELEQPAGIYERRLLDDRRGAGEPVVTDRQLKDVKLRRTSDGRRVWKAFEVARPKILSDPRWVCSAVAMAWRDVHGRAEFVDAPPIVQLENDARILLVGDWGSGLPRAQKVAARMVEELANGGRAQPHVIHLGDVYCSGSKREYERRFLKYWPVAQGAHIGSYSLNGNHDMYTGGHAYYRTCLTDPRFERQNGCSFFALRNDYWQFLALDTTYEDGGLHGRQAEWARSPIADAPAMKNALVSHHQLFSAHEDGAETLVEKIRPVLDTGRVDAWAWGHEHRCIEYAETRWDDVRVGFSSCIGHGGIPEYLVMKEGSTKPQPWVYEYLRHYGTGWEPWDTFGFAVLELSDDRMKVRYIDEDGSEHRTVEDIQEVR